ncbi:hypothetical protein [Palleronia sp. LCG004]|uniref:hypothetical protein n=1 Tax=Palleronia sp. LCG004 TaxID=3079304 RepID=UPI00294245BC|nr:hypothetical protein [Palleronia sp. LCG004]WOI57869.1 hypothetical protein RVY76_14760 [Palleronia sp. LCG004]
MTHSYRVAFGDIHNHNGHGYGKGSIERSLDIAREHLDFYAFTGHSSWHDLAVGTDPRFDHFSRGFDRLAETWPRVQKAIAEANLEEGFAAFLGFEWHSNFYGDQCVIFADDNREMCYAQDIEGLRAFCRENGAILLPHHVAYPKGVRGLNWDEYDPSLSPVVEIFSMHGCSESDTSPFPMKIGSPGGRSTAQTIQHNLAKGARFGFTGSTDSHRGFPGAYGEGLMGALVEGVVSRDSVMEAIHARRTYALTGDKIEVGFTVDGAPMGAEIAASDTVTVTCDIQGRDVIDRVELVLNNEVVQVLQPGGEAEGPEQLRLEWGWGPWGDLDKARIVDWEFDLAFDGARLMRHFPCLTSGPFDENRRHRFAPSEAGMGVVSYSSRQEPSMGNPNQAVVMEIEAGDAAEVELRMTRPVEMTRRFRLSDLRAASAEVHTGAYPSESFQMHRIVPAALSRLVATVDVEIPAGSSHLYLRVTQKNGQMAWSSPVFIN